ncbi:helix-turn-helix transcriptional regulator [Clostridium hydrogenum]|uniref:helix-turn-helix transcriptional regulator n=1 Tax=Clostridium hydrogenum TaxID=2855764 RepID=UPI001F3A4A27|nr:helix-turn-helix transcriptional regulator [Clostridium hydrogenum]
MEKLVMTDGEKIKNIRKKYNLKQDEISGEDITRNLISEIETNKANITKKTAEIIIKNLTEIGKKKGVKVTETVDYLTENQIKQATKVLDDYIAELKALSISKDNSFIGVLKDTEEFLINWDIKEKKIIIYELAGDYFYNQAEIYKSISYYERALELTNKIELTENLLTLLRKLSMVYGYIGNYSESIKCCEFALNRFLGMSKENTIIFIYNSAVSYERSKNFTNALDMLNKAEQLIDESDIHKYFKVLTTKAVCLKNLGNYEEALEIYFKLIKIIESNNIYMKLVTHINLINVYMKLNETDNIINSLKIIINDLPHSDDVEYANIYFEVGLTYKYLGDLKNGENYCLKSLKLAKKQKDYFLVNKILSSLIDIYNTLNDCDKMEDIKDEVFFLASNEEKLSQKLILKLVDFYSNNMKKIKEITKFALKFE